MTGGSRAGFDGGRLEGSTHCIHELSQLVFLMLGAVPYYFSKLKNYQPVKLPLAFGKSVNAHAQEFPKSCRTHL